ncbi:MAG: hypothetical protein JWO30_88 [Fibrobacteres bacterium]|nr:hypothetical protein [Fibrobacterota bacterium]
MYLVPVILARKSSLQRRLPQLIARLAILSTLCVFTTVSAQDYSDRAGTAEFQYLETLIFARPAGLAGAYTSLAQGLDAVGYNPAGVSRSEQVRSVSGTMRYHFLGVSSGNVTYGYPGMGGISYAFSAAYINYGRIEELDEQGNASGKKDIPVSFNPSFTASRKANDNLRLGATLKGLSEYLGDYEGSQLALGWGVDLGLQYQPNVRNLGFGLALLNLGRKEVAHTVDGRTGGLLPVSLKGGMYYFPLDLPKAKLAVDLELPWHDTPRLSGGIEYAYNPSLTLRAGSRLDWVETRYYFLKATDQRPGELQGGNALKLASGFTFQADAIGLDYAVQYWYGLSWVHALTIRYALI